MAALSTIVGVLLIAVALNDVFHTLLRPAATGRLTDLVFRATWSIARRRRRGGGASGPLTILATITVWISLVTLGWALIYLPHIPDGFVYSGVDPQNYNPFLEALNFSMVGLTTLGLGDVVPADPVIRVVAPLEALTGFALLSASVSWFIQLYPALGRGRSLALQLTTMHEVGITSGSAGLSDASTASVVRDVTRSLTEFTADLVQNAEIFYFAERDERLSATRAMEYALDLRDAASRSTSADVRIEGQVLAQVIQELARVLADQHPPLAGDTPDAVLRMVADSHGHEIRR